MSIDCKKITIAEEWKNVIGWEGYYLVSNFGRIKSVARKVICRSPHGSMREYSVREKILKLTQSRRGYLMAAFHRPRHKSTLKTIHGVVLTAFVGPRPKDMECRHLDGNRENNKIDNICWGTNKEQIEDRIRHNTIRRGEGIGNGKLTEKDVLAIRKECESGTRKVVSKLKKEYNVSVQTIYAIVNRKTWTHI